MCGELEFILYALHCFRCFTCCSTPRVLHGWSNAIFCMFAILMRRHHQNQRFDKWYIFFVLMFSFESGSWGKTYRGCPFFIIVCNVQHNNQGNIQNETERGCLLNNVLTGFPALCSLFKNLKVFIYIFFRDYCRAKCNSVWICMKRLSTRTTTDFAISNERYTWYL